MDDIFCRDALSPLDYSRSANKLVVTRVGAQEVISNWTAPLVNFNAHADAVAVCFDTGVIVIKQIGLKHLKTKRNLAVTKGLVDQTNKNFA